MAYELPSRVVQAAGERTGVRARAIAGRGSMIAHPARSPCGASTRLAFCGCSMRRWAAARPRDRHTRASRLGMIDLEARPGPAAAHRHRNLHPNELRSAHHRQTSVRREACPPAHRPRRELRSARRLEARPGPAGLAPPSDRAVSPDERDKTPPAPHVKCTTGTKLSPHETRQAEPVQNSPSRRPQWAHPVQNSPHTPQNGDTKPFLACRENFVPLKPPTSQAGRTLYRTQDHLRYETLPTRNPGSSVPHSGVTVWWSARLIWVRSPCDPSRKLSTSDSKRFGGTTMTAPHIIDPAGLLGEALSQASPDLMRSLLQHVINALLSADADTVCGAQ